MGRKKKIMTTETLQPQINLAVNERPQITPEVVATLNGNSVELKETEKSETVQLQLFNNVPPLAKKRNEYGLLEGVNYIFKTDGKVDWRKMIPSEYLVFNKERSEEIERKYGKKLSELSVTEVDDKYLLILLFGIRYLASLRGFSTVRPKVDFSSETKATVTTQINWIPNNDTEMRYESFGDVASATFENTNGFGRLFLESVATNRSFVRAVRNYLEINIVGFDEIKNDYTTKTQDAPQDDPTNINNMLEKAAKDLGVNFEEFKNTVNINYKNSIKCDITKIQSYKDIPPNDCMSLLGILKKRQRELKASNQSV